MTGSPTPLSPTPLPSTPLPRVATTSAPLPPTPILGVPLPPIGPETMSLPASALQGQHEPASDAMTIGVVLEIPEPWASYLQSSRASFGDQQAQAIPTHVTLLPPTSVPGDQVQTVVSHLAEVARTMHPFDLLLEGTDTFRPVSPVVFVRVARGGDGCDAVQRAVRTGPLQRDLTFPFHPHVTVAHHLDDDALDRAAKELGEFSASFRVTAFVLYEHGSDGVWRPRRLFRFGGGPA
jgi:2'-5' RNA ligase